MAYSNQRRNRRNSTKQPVDNTFREPETTRYSHPIHTGIPCTEELNRISGTLDCHSRMLAEILERLPPPGESASE